VLGSTRQIRVWAFSGPVDLRKGFDGLFGLVRSSLGHDPLAGDLFLFVSRNRKRAKVLLWDGTGLCIYSKRLEQGRFAAPWHRGSGRDLSWTVSELQLFLEGNSTVGRMALSPPEYRLKPLT